MYRAVVEGVPLATHELLAICSVVTATETSAVNANSEQIVAGRVKFLVLHINVTR